MNFYCGLNEKSWNGTPVTPGPFAVVSPVYGSKESRRRVNSVTVPGGTGVIQDSGAFCDGPGSRLDFEGAYQRQLTHACSYDYADLITHRASYDLLIDEKWNNGKRTKQRWGEEEAETAVAETVEAARFLSTRETQVGRVLSAQGVEPFQYLRCVRDIIPLLKEGDILGLGGWCITGKMPSVMMPVLRKTMALIIPYASRQGVKRLHIWGVIYAPATGELQWLCDKYGIEVSTDSAGPSMNPAAFSRWGYGDWVNRDYKRPDNPKERGPDRVRHVALTREWLNNLDKTKYYRQGEADANFTHNDISGQHNYCQPDHGIVWA